MKPTLSAAVLAVALVAAGASSADARPRPTRAKRFEANKLFGAGIELGAPTGLTGKYFVASDRALDFGIGEIYDYGDGNGFHIYGDYLWHPVSLLSADAFELPLYFGIGARIWDFDYHAPMNDNGYAIGARVPLGISFDLNNVPIDIFVQLTFVLDFFVDYGPHDIYPSLDGSVGVRYWFE
jgi:hypothetical protein